MDVGSCLRGEANPQGMGFGTEELNGNGNYGEKWISGSGQLGCYTVWWDLQWVG